MNDRIKGASNRSTGQTTKTYEQARQLLECRDIENLIELASDDTCFPEMLYFLSSDQDTEIRTKVAANASTPVQADELLSKDAEPLVREAVGAKIAQSISTLSSNQDATRIAAIAILEDLIEDEEVRVRRIIADELKVTDKLPLHIIQKLARDIDEFVSSPILRHSPILDDEELISIIKDSATSSQLAAIAERKQVSEPVAECIVETADVEAISQLLLNPSAQIRENTLDQLIVDARSIPEWHEPLVMRPKLPFGAISKIAEFVAVSLIEVLAQRNDIDVELREDLETRVRERLMAEDSSDGEQQLETLDELECKLRQLHARDDLTESYIRDHSDQSERNVVILSLAILADIPTIISRRIFVSRSAKAIMSLGWKAGLSAALVTRIQGTVGDIPADHWVLPDEHEEYPFTEREMQWQLALFLDQEENAETHDEQTLEMSVS